jgi:sigma-B regulation protein RsbU (phosphoserine phosphatase)
MRILEMREALILRNDEVRTTLRDLQRLQAGFDRDLDAARALQRGFLQAPYARIGASELSLRLLTCQKIGGDLVGHLPISAHEHALYSIDVAGHGIASALLTGRLTELFATRRPGCNVTCADNGGADPPDRVLRRLDRMMLDEVGGDLYFTAALAYVDTRTGDVRLSQAGHPHPLLRRSGGGVEPLGEGGLPVGLIPGAEFEVTTARMAPGDTLLLCSDGVTECADTWGDMLGEAGLEAALANASGGTEDIAEALERALAAHAGFAGFEDDISMLLFRFGAPSDA